MTCPRCGFENAAGAKFCSECAAPLQGVTSGAPSEERKVVSVLFCDLVGFTAASESADPEDVRARIRPYHATLRHELERYGGTVEKFIGDAVMAVFGAPAAHEDDPERAVRAGLRILEAIVELNEQDARLELKVRIGIATGQAVVSLGARPEEGEGMVAGDVVNTAARIQSSAPVNAVAVSGETYRQTERVFTYESLEPVAVKGKREAVELYRAVEARARFGADLIRAQDSPFVGRDVEKTLLQGLFDRCARDSAVQLVTLVGEPGVGKSRLCAELFRYVDERVELTAWRQGRCLPYGDGITFWALGEIVKAHAGIFESDSAEVAGAKLENVLADGEERDWLEARLLPLLGVGSGQSVSRDESFLAWRRFVESIASDGPAVVVVEDLHWADTALLDFLSYLAEWAEGVPLLLLCTARPELFEAHPTWGAGTRNAHMLSLAPLSERETDELVQGLLEQAVSEQVQAAILERAGGNPLYAEEFVRLVADRGLGGDDAGIAFPESVHALIAARLDTLTPERKGLLQDAAVLGKVFWAGALVAMGERDEHEVEFALHELSRKELVRPARRSSMEGESEYAFWHVLVRDVAYGQIPRAARARKHRAAAAWLEAKAGERVEDLADVLAFHYQEALELARAAGDDAAAAELLPDVRRTLVLAGDRATALDQELADEFYRRALALYEPDDPAQAPVLLKAARTASSLSGARAEEDAVRATELFLLGRDELGAADALLDLARYLGWEGRYAEGRERTAEARELIERHPPGRVLAKLLMREAGSAAMDGRVAEGLEATNAAVEMAVQQGADEYLAAALQYRGIARADMGDLGGLEDLEESLARSRQAGRALETGIAHLNLAGEIWFCVGAREGLDRYEITRAFDEAHGLRGAVMWSRAESTWVRYDLGCWDEVIEITDELAAVAEDYGSGEPKMLGLPFRALVLACRGDRTAAVRVVEDVLPKARAATDPQLLAPTLAVASLVSATQTESGGLRDLVRELLEVTRGRADRYRAHFLPDIARMCAARDALDLARELADGLTVEIGRVGCSRVAAAAVFAEAEARLPDALALHEQAATRWESYGSVPGRADALLGQARCLVALDREADAPLTEARGLYATLGHAAGLAELDELLGAARSSPA